LSQRIPRSVPEMPKRSRVLLGPFGPVTHSTSDVGAPAMEAGGSGGTVAAGSGFSCPAFGDGWLPAPGGLGPGGMIAACWRTGAFGWIKEEISGPSLGSGARSFAPRGFRPGGRTTGVGELAAGGGTGAAAGGSTFASGALQGRALAGGAGPPATTSPIATADTADTDTIRGTGDTSHLSAGRTSQLTSAGS
jgi:hypothetical protein